MLFATVYPLLLLVLPLVWIKWRRSANRLHHIPGPTTGWRDMFQRRDKKELRGKSHLMLTELKQKYGNVFRIRFSDFQDTVVVSDFDLIYKVYKKKENKQNTFCISDHIYAVDFQILVKQGKEFGGRLSAYTLKTIFDDSGILFNKSPDKTWRTLRQVSQKHLRQFGEGLSRLESIIGLVAEDMFSDISNNLDKPYNPRKIIFDTALNSIAFLITGERTYTGEPIIEKMREYQGLLLGTVSSVAPTYFNLLNHFPWLRYIGFDRWDKYQRFLELHNDIWNTVKEMNAEKPESASICEVLMSHLAENGGILKESDAQAASLALLFAGVITTSSTFYATINILAHHREVQEKLLAEIENTKDQSEGIITLAKRNMMPYARATLFEILRLTSIAAMGVSHRTVVDTKLGDFKIPTGSLVLTNLWSLHHDDKFWQDPYKVQPERFLDASGDVVPADHPNRTHLMPFGAGTRVCLGESMALSRLFFWITTLVERFEIEPSSGNEKASTDPRNYWFEGVLRPHDYQVTFYTRK